MMALRDFTTLAAAAADPTRVRVLLLLGDGPLAVGVIAAKLGFAASTVSYHVTVLDQAGLVTVTRRGRRHLVRRVPGRWAAVTMAFGS
jgi:DNA-binding transcriptional ArsR family regulator